MSRPLSNEEIEALLDRMVGFEVLEGTESPTEVPALASLQVSVTIDIPENGLQNFFPYLLSDPVSDLLDHGSFRFHRVVISEGGEETKSNSTEETHLKIATQTTPCFYKDLKQPDLDRVDGRCNICLNALGAKTPSYENDVLLVLNCDHVFHHDCVVPWLLEKKTCPLCRHKL